MSFEIVQNTVAYVDPNVYALDTGWTISAGIANHVACNSGLIKSINNLGLTIGRQYTFKFTVSNYTSGSVNINAGSVAGTSRTANGDYTENLTVEDNTLLSFFSDGNLSISNLSFYDTESGQVAGTTITFHEGSNTWGAERSYNPELMIKFINQFLMVKNGQLWLSNVNPVRNNFFGVQYISQVRFFDNVNPTTVKIYYTTRVESNMPWGCPGDTDIVIYPTVGRPAGMNSRLKKGNFKNYQGEWFADFLRNSIDPRFDDTLTALFRGEPLRGRIMDITFSNDDTVEVILFEIDIKSAASSITY